MILFVYVSSTAETEAAFPKKTKKYFVVQPFQSPDVNKYARDQKWTFYRPRSGQVLGYCKYGNRLALSHIHFTNHEYVT